MKQMATAFTASQDPRLEAVVTGSSEMIYVDGSSEEDDRPPFVLAASGLSMFREHLAVIQDDANWLALIDAEQRVSAVPLPPGPNGKRVFTKARGNQQDKFDFEACITVPGEQGFELIGFASCSAPERVWILRVRETNQGAPDQAERLHAEFVNAHRLYTMLRQETAFCGAGLNIEGAVALDGERILLFQRGNAEPCRDLEPVDATGEILWSELKPFLDDPDRAPLPTLRNIRRYDLGNLHGVRLTFSDAEYLADGRILYSASAEEPATGDIAGSVLGVLEADGAAHWTTLIDAEGQTFTGKIEGLTRDVHDNHKIHFVIDDDDDAVPSKIYQAMLNHAFFQSPDAASHG
jgi:hypothetical protein